MHVPSFGGGGEAIRLYPDLALQRDPSPKLELLEPTMQLKPAHSEMSLATKATLLIGGGLALGAAGAYLIQTAPVLALASGIGSVAGSLGLSTQAMAGLGLIGGGATMATAGALMLQKPALLSEKATLVNGSSHVDVDWQAKERGEAIADEIQRQVAAAKKRLSPGQTETITIPLRPGRSGVPSSVEVTVTGPANEQGRPQAAE